MALADTFANVESVTTTGGAGPRFMSRTRGQVVLKGPKTAGANVPGGRFATPRGWRRFGATPAWVLLPQLFLAGGWLRVGVANGITDGWWSGEALRRFLEVDTSQAVRIYEPFLSHVVEPFAVVVAAILRVAELAIATLLALNRRVLSALLVATFLNVHFMLAGAVNPSAFYLVIAMVIAVWWLDKGASAATRGAIARRAALVAAVATLGLAPFVTTVHPAQVIKDPAIVLIFLSVLFSITTWWAHREPATESHESPQFGTSSPTVEA